MLVTIKNPTAFAKGDGATQRFTVAPGINVSVDQIYNNDALGLQLLYPTPRTNLVRNSMMVGTIAGSPGTLPTNWSVALSGGMSRQVVGSGIQNGIAYVDIRIFGTPTSTSVNAIYFDATNVIPSSNGQVWTASAYVALVGGSLNSVVSLALGYRDADAANSTLASGVAALISVQPNLSRYSAMHTVTVANPAFTTTSLRWGYSNTTTAVDFTLRVGLPQIELGSLLTPAIQTQGNAVTITDYSLSLDGDVIFAIPPSFGAQLSWTGSYDPVGIDFHVHNTIISQYANSATLRSLIESMRQYFDPSANFAQFYKSVWDIDTARGFGLDVWGKIVNIPRVLRIPGSLTYFGFAEQGGTAQPFGQQPFYAGAADTQSYTLTDDVYRTLILTKALANISSCTAPSLNALLRNLFAGRGRCYVVDQGNMSMLFTFEFPLQPFEIAILTQSGVIPKPAGVSAKIQIVDYTTMFGFAETGNAQPFNQGVFFNPDSSIIPVN